MFELNSNLPIPMRIISLFFILIFSATAFAQDIAGSKDHPLVGRYEGAVIKKYSTKAYEELSLVNRPVEKYADRDKKELHSIDVSGKLTRIIYEGPAERSILEVVRNYQKKLESDGFQTLFFCKLKECGEAPAFWTVANNESGLRSIWDTNTYLLLKKNQDGADIWVSIYGVESSGTATNPLTPHVLLSVVESKPMEADKVQVKDAGAIGSAIDTAGRIAIYGIHFDFDKAEIKAESTPQLNEIAKLLKERPALNILIVGHTDSKGSLDYNTNLSQQRAASVKSALVREHQILAERLTPIGIGMASPVASNREEEGRAKNRRVEIVER